MRFIEKRLHPLRMLLASVFVFMGLVAVTQTPAQANNTESATIGMPLTGKWADDNGVFTGPPYSNSDSSHPTVHPAPSFDPEGWATDLYPGSSTDVKLSVSGTGTVTFANVVTWTSSCGEGVRFTVKVDSVAVGQLAFAHLVDAPSSVSNNTVIGQVKTTCSGWTEHLHFEAVNNLSGTYSCYTDHGDPGTTVAQGADIGKLGSDNTGARQECSDPSGGGSGGPEPNYQPFAGDFNGDGVDDIGLRKVSTGTFFIKYGPDYDVQLTHNWASTNNFEPFAGDFNGDGVDDIGLRKVSTGVWFIRYGPNFGTQITHTWASTINFQPFAGDFNCDGVDDIGLRKVSTGVLYIRFGPGPGFGPQITHNWGATTHNFQPFAGDFNGDCVGDVGLRKISNGVWFIRYGPGPSFGPQATHTWATTANFQPFTGDFNGDGVDDIGLRKVSTGRWYFRYGPGPNFGPQGTYQWASG